MTSLGYGEVGNGGKYASLIMGAKGVAPRHADNLFLIKVIADLSDNDWVRSVWKMHPLLDSIEVCEKLK